MNKSNLLLQIREAFDSTKYPGDSNILIKSNSLEAMDVFNFFKGKNWEEVDLDCLSEENSSLAFLSEDGFIYYLPTFMKLILYNLELADVQTEQFINRLTLPDSSEYFLFKLLIGEKVTLNKEALEVFSKEATNRINKFIRIVNRFSKKQSEVIYLFLDYLIQNSQDFVIEEDALKAISRYWFIYGKIKSKTNE